MTTLIDLSEASWLVCSRSHTPMKQPVAIEESPTWPWSPIQIPNDILSHLLSTGQIQDPLIEQNDLMCRWVEDLDWVFRAIFDVPEPALSTEEDLLLVVQDIDCYGELFLNGGRIGSVSNQFRMHRFDIEEFIKPGTNELLIYIRSAKHVTELLERAHGKLPSGFDTARVHARRCQCLTGWDWAARLSSVSIMSLPSIEREPAHLLRHPYVYLKELAPVTVGATSADSVMLSVQVDVLGKRKATGVITLQVLDDRGVIVAEANHAVTIKAGESTTRAALRLDHAQLWWPLGLGDQPMYKLVLSLSATDRAGGTSASVIQTTFAVRTTGLDRKKDAEGETFIPMVNGHPVFCRGANWIPVSMLPAEQTGEQYRGLIAAAAAAGMNCLRIWGGGLYEPDHFYDVCDRLGILVWQDFMFACAAYPTYREFEDEVELEARYQVQRLRNHPCLLLWCGNNENEWLHQIGELRKGNEKNIIGEPLWRSVLKSIVEDLDPSRPYHQSSPFGKKKTDYNDQGTGDRHNWECWSRWQSPEMYMKDRGRFLSEFGFQGMPAAESIRKFAAAAADIDDPVLIHHQKMVQGQERLARYMTELHKLPTTFEGWIEGTQQLQAEILRRAIEHWRRRKFATAGTLIWQLHDAYPAVSWALIDYYREPKLAYQMSRRFFSPVLLTIGLELGDEEVGSFPRESWALAGESPVEGDEQPEFHADKRIAVYLVNDTRFAINGELRIAFRRPGGEELSSEISPLSAEPNSNSSAAVVQLSELNVRSLCDIYIHAEFTPDEGSQSAIDDLQARILSKCSKVLPPSFDKFRSVDFHSALRTDALLVESKYFQWSDGIIVNGVNRPSWY
ncbi:MAG: beta-mannosidase [Candidatus Sumerlaeaceae bacterium]